jgi:hypothetical protein
MIKEPERELLFKTVELGERHYVGFGGSPPNAVGVLKEHQGDTGYGRDLHDDDNLPSTNTE